MIIHDFDISTEPVVNIESFYGKQRKIVEKCCFSVKTLTFIEKEYIIAMCNLRQGNLFLCSPTT